MYKDNKYIRSNSFMMYLQHNEHYNFSKYSIRLKFLILYNNYNLQKLSYKIYFYCFIYIRIFSGVCTYVYIIDKLKKINTLSRQSLKYLLILDNHNICKILN